jgi:hypothetical protein
LVSSGEIRYEILRGCKIIPTQRSVQARQRTRSFDEEWRDDTFGRAAMIRRLPRIAVIEIIIFNADRNIF